MGFGQFPRKHRDRRQFMTDSKGLYSRYEGKAGYSGRSSPNRGGYGLSGGFSRNYRPSHGGRGLMDFGQTRLPERRKPLIGHRFSEHERRY